MVVITDEFKDVVEAIRVSLDLPSLKFDFGPREELNLKLKSWNNSPVDREGVYPLIWLKHPFTISRGKDGSVFGTLKDCMIFIIQYSAKEDRAEKRVSDVFKPTIYPIYDELIKQIHLATIFSTQAPETIGHDFTEMYDLGIFDQNVDCGLVSGLQLIVNFKQNCVPVNF